MIFLYSYETVAKRWPIIITGIIDTVYRMDHDLGMKVSENSPDVDAVAANEKIAEGKTIIEKISKLKYEMARDRPLE